MLIAYDRDDAGDRAAEKLAAQLIDAGIECLRVRFPKGMDPNSTAAKLTPARQSLGLMLRQAEWIGRGPCPDAPVVPPEVGGAPQSVPESAPLLERIPVGL